MPSSYDHGHLSSWGSSLDCCHWSSVLCHPQIGHIEALDLPVNQEGLQPLQGKIPNSMGSLSQLKLLILRNNCLGGGLSSLKNVTELEMLYLDETTTKNPYLCGRPLDKLCSFEDHPLGNGTQANQVVDEDDSFTKGFYESSGVGFAVGFWIVFGSLLVIRSWRHAYFNFLNKLADSIYVTTVIHVENGAGGFVATNKG
ncbi:receptor-like protein EIX2 [Prosopis cineraria]|uniref:receptor-like protein EIX2 n=1 Tax=Prosopis cineraria TaxID=364024 RepID=UPI00240F060C|nr:receptor-like protein EIX2 [Prosopis cineraria]